MDNMDEKKCAQTILAEAGGKENVVGISQCVTRLRLDLKDNALVDKEAIAKIPFVQGVVLRGGQYQIVLGSKASKVTTALSELVGVDRAGEEETAAPTVRIKRSIPKTIIDYVTGSIAPIIPALIAAGMIRSVVSLLTAANLLTAGSSTHTLLTAFGTAGLYFIPIMLAASASGKLKSNLFLAIMMGGILIIPEFNALVSAGEPITFFGLPVTAINYGSTFIPILLTMPLLALVEKFFSKRITNVLRPIIVPAISILITAPVSLIVLAPLAHLISGKLAYVINFIYYNTSVFGGLIIGGLSPFLVLTGLHTAISFPIFFNELTTTGQSLYLSLLSMANLSVGGAALGVALRARKKNFKGEAFGAGVSGIFGITEPALFGILLRVKRPLYAVGIASAIAGMCVTLFDIKANGMGGGGILAFPMYFGPQFVPYLLTAAGVIVLSAAIAYFLGFDEGSVAEDKD